MTKLSKKAKEEATGAELLTKASKPKAAKTKSSAKTKPKGNATSGFDFVGKVESIAVNSNGEAGSFEFGLRTRHGTRQTLRLRTSDTFALTVMAPIVTAAHATQAKIGVRISPADAGQIYVVEVASQPKLGKSA